MMLKSLKLRDPSYSNVWTKNWWVGDMSTTKTTLQKLRCLCILHDLSQQSLVICIFQEWEIRMSTFVHLVWKESIHQQPSQNACAKGWVSAIADLPIGRLTRMSHFESHHEVKFLLWLMDLTGSLMLTNLCVCVNLVCKKYMRLPPLQAIELIFILINPLNIIVWMHAIFQLDN